MPRFILAIALVLIILGLAGYFGTGRASVTALIPAFFGMPIGLAGLIALKLSLSKPATYAAAALGLIGFLGSAVRSVPKLLSGEESPSTAVYMQLAMAVVCLVLVVACIWSFIKTRQHRAGTQHDE